MESNSKNEFKKNIVKKSYRIMTMLVAFVTSIFLWYWNISPYWDEGYSGKATLFAIGVLYCITYWFFAKMYQANKIGVYRLTELTYFQLLSYFFADALIAVAMIFWFHGISQLKILSFFITLLVQMVVVVFLIFVHNRLFAKYDEATKVLIIYGNSNYTSLARKIKAKKTHPQIIGCYSDTTENDTLKEYINKCDRVYLYEVDRQLRRELILYCDSMNKDIYLSQDVEDLITMGFDISHSLDTPFIRTKRVPVKWYYPMVKRLVDIVCSGIACIVLLPLFIIVGIAIKLYDGGPVFYVQERVTENHKKFMIYKFRSMVTDAEAHGMRRATDNDDRITPVGKIIRATRIDELPQILNILKGDMSIVGPRPERVELDEAYTKQLPEFALRLKVRAGLTGYAQVFGKYNTTPEDKLKLDLLYINQRSLLLDFKLILYTVKIMFIPESTEGFGEDETTLEDIEKK